MKFDIVFISYDEESAESNWVLLKKRFPKSIRIHGVDGILKAHKVASDSITKNWFFVVDGDNKIKDDFNFELPEDTLNQNATYVWRCVNSVNGLCYGNGGIKLFNKSLFQGVDQFSGDMTLSLSHDYRIVNVVASETIINTSRFYSWRSSFRECVKLSIPRKKPIDDTIRIERLKVWHKSDDNIPFSAWVSKGAEDAVSFYEQHNGDKDFLFAVINDYKWLREIFFSKYG
ncbi:hypothetical protein [Brenneria tiliae]|uniref:Glycosyltransferase 2-like domain-containing protein n=1 Tax=Brenneria tiliae TaxID=2914984 RepID=A0ABT0MN11_9GAMM|nr:hypothetical protein [Brenneria tiliae]MCL2891231.1 hypothetical protein [Brenneria tiliae]